MAVFGNCPNCSKSFTLTGVSPANYCPSCGKEMPPPSPQKISEHQLPEDNPVQQAARKGFDELMKGSEEAAQKPKNS